LRSEISGRVIKIAFTEGHNVRQGDLLVKLYDADLQAQLKKALHKRDLLAKNEARQRALLEKKAVSQEAYDNALNELSQIDADIELINSQIRKTEIIAPFDGFAGLRYVSEGAYVTPSTKIASLQNTNMLKIDFAVPQSYYDYVKIGSEIGFRIHGKPALIRQGFTPSNQRLTSTPAHFLCGRCATR
jgi:membrane fusion protein (multidrug efflux system)